MRSQTKQPRENRTITVDFQNEAIYFQLLDDGKAFVELVMAFVLSIGFQLKHKATCSGGGCMTRHSHYLRLRLGGVSIWRIQCTTCTAVFTVPAPLRPPLSPDAPGGGPRCPVGHTRWPQFGAVRGNLPYLAHGPLSPGLCVWPPGAGDGPDAVWAALAHLFLGKREAQPLSDRQSVSPHDRQWPRALASRLYRGGECRGLH